ncbi:MAG: hypothetical protein WBL27_10930 [Salinimicrobium sp.]
MKILKLNYVIAGLLCFTSAFAQTKKMDRSFKTNKDVTVTVDAKNTDLQVEYWDKNEVQVEAILNMPKAEKKQLDQALANWSISTKATAGAVTINSTGGGMPNFDMAGLQEPLSRLPEMLAPIQKMVGPLLESMTDHPLPPEFYANVGNVNFDYEAYQKDGDKYLEKFEAQIEKKFGKDFQKSMEEWAKNFEKDSVVWKSRVRVMEDWGDQFGEDMEKWGEDFGKDMEKWGESFGKDMEAWAANLEKEVEKKYGDSKGKVIVLNGSSLSDKGMDAKKVLKIKMPRNGQLKLDVRYGNVKLDGTTNNLQANLTHSKFMANTIAGEKTDVKVAYTPVQVKNWDYGVLKASYTDELKIDKVRSIKLSSNSTDVKVQQLEQNGIFRGSFGELVIEKVSDRFTGLDIVLENSDLKLDLPDVAYNFQYNGTKSEIKLLDDLKVKSSKSYDNQKLVGYNKNRDANATVSISANFSDVLLK